LFKSILAESKSFPKDQAYKDLVALMNYILRQFFKALEKEPFLAIEVRIFGLSRDFRELMIDFQLKFRPRHGIILPIVTRRLISIQSC